MCPYVLVRMNGRTDRVAEGQTARVGRYAPLWRRTVAHPRASLRPGTTPSEHSSSAASSFSSSTSPMSPCCCCHKRPTRRESSSLSLSLSHSSSLLSSSLIGVIKHSNVCPDRLAVTLYADICMRVVFKGGFHVR